MRFWLVTLLASGPVVAASLVLRVLAWLVVMSGVVLWWGPGDAVSDRGRVIVALGVGAGLWLAAGLPRWAAFRLGAWIRL